MLGSILSNLLLVMGMCFFLGGIFNMRDARGNGREQVFASGTAQTACSLMTLSSASLVIPATLFMVLGSDKDKTAAHKSVLILSRGTAVILLLLYCLYLFFQLRTHKNLFNPEEPESAGEDDTEEEEVEQSSMTAWSAAAILIATTSHLLLNMSAIHSWSIIPFSSCHLTHFPTPYVRLSSAMVSGGQEILNAEFS
jgi:Ca2+:H+ antiporter